MTKCLGIRPINQTIIHAPSLPASSRPTPGASEPAERPVCPQAAPCIHLSFPAWARDNAKLWTNNHLREHFHPDLKQCDNLFHETLIMIQVTLMLLPASDGVYKYTHDLPQPAPPPCYTQYSLVTGARVPKCCKPSSIKRFVNPGSGITMTQTTALVKSTKAYVVP